MVSDKLHPISTLLGVSVLFALMGVLGSAAEAGQIQAAPSATMLSSTGVETQTPSPLQRPINDRAPLPLASQRSKTAGTKGAAAQPITTARNSAVSVAAGRRDPFKPAESAGAGSHLAAGGDALPPGNRGLVISQLRVEGIVRLDPTNNMLAMVTNYTKRAYFLKENDTVYNGVVSKITSDAVYFKEKILDSNGRLVTHEVVMKLGSAAGEGR